MRRLLCLNQFVPPDPAPTSLLLAELGAGLARHGWEVGFVGGGGTYRVGKSRGFSRWLGELRCHLGLVWRAIWMQKPAVVLCMTDPPGLPFTAALIARLHGAKLVHWAMDVYPEVAAALGEVRRESLVYRAVNAMVKASCRRCDLIACLDEDMAVLMGLKHDPRLMLCPPWPPRNLSLPDVFPAPSPQRIRWLYSGNLGRAHEFETLLQAQRLLEDADMPVDLVFQGGGTMRIEAVERSRELGLRHCHWEDYAPEQQFISSLMEAHVLVASQKPETRGMVWPSKLALMRQLPRPIVWVGAVDGAIADMLRADGPRHGVFAPGQHVELARWLLERADVLRVPDDSLMPADLSARLSRLRDDRLEQWRQRLDDLTRAPQR